MTELVVNLTLLLAVLVVAVTLVVGTGRCRRADRRRQNEERSLILQAFVGAAAQPATPQAPPVVTTVDAPPTPTVEAARATPTARHRVRCGAAGPARRSPTGPARPAHRFDQQPAHDLVHRRDRRPAGRSAHHGRHPTRRRKRRWRRAVLRRRHRTGRDPRPSPWRCSPVIPALRRRPRRRRSGRAVRPLRCLQRLPG